MTTPRNPTYMRRRQARLMAEEQARLSRQLLRQQLSSQQLRMSAHGLDALMRDLADQLIGLPADAPSRTPH